MTVLIALALNAAMATPAPYLRGKAECALAAVVLADLAPSNKSAGNEVLVSGPESNPSSIFATCPELLKSLKSLPAHWRIAAKADLARMADLTSSNPVTVWNLDLPKISADGQAAMVSYSYTCNGLCGAGFQVRYEHKHGVWKRASQPQQMWVS
jgi:hypothetical protein